MKLGFHMKNGHIFGLTLLALTAPAGARAQTAAPADEAGTDEIIVTAQRRAETLEAVPMSVLAVSAEMMEKANVQSVLDVGRIAPGVQINFAGVSTQPAIRGISTLTNGSYVENNVPIYIDGFYQPNSTALNADLANVASMEVLKGPQGTLYGRNATGGAILINTRGPSDTFTGRFEGTYARFDDKNFTGFLAGPISQGVRFSVAGYFRESDGYITLIANPLTGEGRRPAAPLKQHSLRTKLEVDLAENLTATLGYSYQLSSDGRGQIFTPKQYVPASQPQPPLRATKLDEASYNYTDVLHTLAHTGTLKLAWDTDLGTITTYTGYTRLRTRTRFDFDGTFVDLSLNESRIQQETFQQAADVSVTAIEHVDLVMGALYYHDRYRYAPDFGAKAFSRSAATGQLALTSTLQAAQTTQAFAAYIDGTYHLTDALSVNAGGRYSYEEKSIDQSLARADGSFIIVPTHRSVSFSRFTPRVSLRYEVAPRTNVYATWSRGFRSGTYNMAAPASVALILPTAPEDVDAYEVGFKTAQRGFRFEVAGFYYDYTNINATLTVPSPACAGVPNCTLVASIFSNAKAAEIYGIDGQITLTPVEGLEIRAGAAWVHARYKDFKNAVGIELDPVTLTNVANKTQDWSGFQMARAPTFSGNIGADYTTTLAGGSLLLAGNVNYTDSYVISNPSLFCSAVCSGGLERKQRYRAGKYALVSAQVTWTDPSDH